MLYLIGLLFIYFPLSFILSVDPKAAGDSQYDYVDDDPSLSTELPGKRNPLDQPDIAHSFSLVLALGFATIVVPIAPNLMHSLLL